MATPSPTSFLARAHKSELTRLRKKVADLDKRMADMKAARGMLVEQIDEHEAQIKEIGGAP